MCNSNLVVRNQKSLVPIPFAATRLLTAALKNVCLFSLLHNSIKIFFLWMNVHLWKDDVSKLELDSLILKVGGSPSPRCAITGPMALGPGITEATARCPSRCSVSVSSPAKSLRQGFRKTENLVHLRKSCRGASIIHPAGNIVLTFVLHDNESGDEQFRRWRRRSEPCQMISLANDGADQTGSCLEIG